jgi:hypothetical protein
MPSQAESSLRHRMKMLFPGFHLAWKIELIDGERVMHVWINDNALQSALTHSSAECVPLCSTYKCFFGD